MMKKETTSSLPPIIAIRNVAFRNDSPYNRCKSIKFELKVNWNGDVPLCRFQCAFKEEEIIANAHQSTLQDIWMSARLQDARQIHRNKNLEQLSYCKACQKVQVSTPMIRKFWK